MCFRFKAWLHNMQWFRSEPEKNNQYVYTQHQIYARFVTCMGCWTSSHIKKKKIQTSSGLLLPLDANKRDSVLKVAQRLTPFEKLSYVTTCFHWWLQQPRGAENVSCPPALGNENRRGKKHRRQMHAQPRAHTARTVHVPGSRSVHTARLEEADADSSSLTLTRSNHRVSEGQRRLKHDSSAERGVRKEDNHSTQRRWREPRRRQQSPPRLIRVNCWMYSSSILSSS